MKNSSRSPLREILCVYGILMILCPSGSETSPLPSPEVLCGEDQFLCKIDKLCISIEWVCDGSVECSDVSDEINCSTENATAASVPAPPCGEDEYRCQSDNVCIGVEYVCNGEIDCLDKGDEWNCTTSVSCKENELRCKITGHCVNLEYICDGSTDCIDNSDEENCPETKTHPVITTVHPTTPDIDLADIPNLIILPEPFLPAEEFTFPENFPFNFYDEFNLNTINTVQSNISEATESSTVAFNNESTTALREYNRTRENETWQVSEAISNTTFSNDVDVTEGNSTFYHLDSSIERTTALMFETSEEYWNETEENVLENLVAIESSQLFTTSITSDEDVSSRITMDVSSTDISTMPTTLSMPTTTPSTTSITTATTPTITSTTTTTTPTTTYTTPTTTATTTTATTTTTTTATTTTTPTTTTTTTTRRTTTPYPCRRNEFYCRQDLNCIPAEWRCDHTEDCWDGSDERNCDQVSEHCPYEEEMMHCEDTGQCIYTAWLCDGHNDCDTGSDEYGCPTTTAKPKEESKKITIE